MRSSSPFSYLRAGHKAGVALIALRAIVQIVGHFVLPQHACAIVPHIYIQARFTAKLAIGISSLACPTSNRAISGLLLLARVVMVCGTCAILKRPKLMHNLSNVPIFLIGPVPLSMAKATILFDSL